jgi:hypothetical protein
VRIAEALTIAPGGCSRLRCEAVNRDLGPTELTSLELEPQVMVIQDGGLEYRKNFGPLADEILSGPKERPEN